MVRKLFCAIAAIVLVCSLRAQDADGVYTKVDENPSPTKTVKPQYPAELRRDGVEGLVAVSIVIDENGDVITSKVAKSSNKTFESFAIEAVNKWKFKPAKKDGKTVKVKVTIPFRFSIDE
jgi:protein TonB